MPWHSLKRHTNLNAYRVLALRVRRQMSLNQRETVFQNVLWQAEADSRRIFSIWRVALAALLTLSVEPPASQQQHNRLFVGNGVVTRFGPSWQSLFLPSASFVVAFESLLHAKLRRTVQNCICFVFVFLSCVNMVVVSPRTVQTDRSWENCFQPQFLHVFALTVPINCCYFSPVTSSTADKLVAADFSVRQWYFQTGVSAMHNIQASRCSFPCRSHPAVRLIHWCHLFAQAP